MLLRFKNKKTLFCRPSGLFLCICLFLITSVSSAQDRNKTKREKKAEEYMVLAQKAMGENNFPVAEANYRKAIALDPENAKAKYNMGTLYYTKEQGKSALKKLGEAGKKAQSKALKHRAYHNQGNTWMKGKKYKKAIAAYKNALLNDPTDDQTRYNLALAKKKLKEKQDKQKKNQKNSPKDKKNKKDKNKGQDQKKKDQKGGGKKNKDDQKKGDDKNQKDNKPKNKDQKNKGDQKQKNQQNKSPKQGDKKQKQPTNGGLSKQQVRNLLEAMKNQEKRVQKKLNAAKSKGNRVKTAKDW